MQYWIFFSPGVGGDGFGNLLEHADNMYPADGKSEWRIHKQFERTVKFRNPNWFVPRELSSQPFRDPEYSLTDWSTGILHQQYINAISQQLNTVITTHPEQYFNCIESFPYKNFIKRDQFKILLYSLNIDRVVNDQIIKNGNTFSSNSAQYTEIRIRQDLNSDLYNLHVDIEQVWKSWEYLDNILKQLGITLKKQFYDEYIKLVNPI